MSLPFPGSLGPTPANERTVSGLLKIKTHTTVWSSLRRWSSSASSKSPSAGVSSSSGSTSGYSSGYRTSSVSLTEECSRSHKQVAQTSKTCSVPVSNPSTTSSGSTSNRNSLSEISLHELSWIETARVLYDYELESSVGYIASST